MRSIWVVLIALLLAISACAVSDEPVDAIGESSTTTSTTIAVSPTRAAEQALVDSLHSQDRDGVWVDASDEVILELANVVCRRAETATLLHDAGGSEAGQLLVGLLMPPESTDTDLIRVGALVGALSQSTLCSPDAVATIDEAIDFIVEFPFPSDGGAATDPSRRVG